MPPIVALVLPSFGQVSIAAVAGIGVYTYFVRTRRWQRYQQVHKRFQDRAIESITPNEAQEIVHTFGMWDMPSLQYYAFAFALFKTYGIPTISAILWGTNEFVLGRTPKRFADTEILIDTWVNCPISGSFDLNATEDLDPRAMIALSRVNWMHSKYPIKNDDFLYTLSLFILEPIRWAKMYGWRELSPLECQAQYVFWKEIGIRMGMKDIPGSLPALAAWAAVSGTILQIGRQLKFVAQNYEELNMVPAESNQLVAQHTLDELLYAVPRRFGLRNLVERCVFALLEDRTRVAMRFPEQPKWLHNFMVFQAKAFFGFFHGYLSLPRSKPYSLVQLERPLSDPKVCPRMRPTSFKSKPWYKPEATGIWSLWDRLMVAVGVHSSLPSAKTQSEGYLLQELGPEKYRKVGHEEVMRNAEQLAGFKIRAPWSNSN